ncbi:MAG: ATP-dependent Clp protease proteolytic subunit [Myxococcales bacterium]|nr:ATP-dependent Clp protease proteolytic subunit [Myxococcales bacterium]
MTFETRKAAYERLATERNSTVISFITGHRTDLPAQINPDAIPVLVEHLDLIGVTRKISLFLNSTGGSITAAWTIANLLRQFCDELEVIVPYKAHSAATLICMAADIIVMTKQATLGPVDPSITHLLNPVATNAIGARQFVPISVEAVNGYVEFLRNSLVSFRSDGPTAAGAAGDPKLQEPSSGGDLSDALAKLADHVHPIVLGEVYRQRGHIRMLAKRLLMRTLKDDAQLEKVLAFLCGDSGNHEYTIFRREAETELKLKIQKPGEAGYRLVKAIYDDFATEMLLDRELKVGPNTNTTVPVALIESLQGGEHRVDIKIVSDQHGNVRTEPTGWLKHG